MSITKYQGIPVQTKVKRAARKSPEGYDKWSDAQKGELLAIPMETYNKSTLFKQFAKRENKTLRATAKMFYHLHKLSNIKVNSKTKQAPNWRQEEITQLMDICSRFSNKSKGFIEAAKQLNRTPQACATKHNQTVNSNVTATPVVQAKPLFIPEVREIKQTPQLFMETVQVTMFKALDGSLHEKSEYAIKANVRTIIDSIPDKDAEDSVMHEYFFKNKDKVEYLMSVQPSTLWN